MFSLFVQPIFPILSILCPFLLVRVRPVPPPLFISFLSVPSRPVGRPVPSVALLIPLGPTVFRFVRSFGTAHYIVNVRSASSVHGSVGTVRSVGSPALTVLHCQDISLDFFRQCSTLLRTRSGEIAPSYTSANFYFINFRRESSNCGNI